MATLLDTRSSPPMHRLISVLAGACVVAGLSVLAQMASQLEGALPLYWPATGLAFAMLCTQGKHAAWSVALGVGVAGLLLHTHSPGFLPFVMLAAVAGPWLSWRRLQVRFAGTSQPFARLTTVLAFLRIQVLQGAPLSASVLVLGTALLGPELSPAQWMHTLFGYWVTSLCGALVFAPLAWELLVARTRGGLPRFAGKLLQAVQADWPTLLAILACAALSGSMWWAEYPRLARASLLLLLPVLALHATRASPLGVHLMALIAAVSALTATAVALPHAPGSTQHTELLLATLAVTLGIATTQLLLVTAHERRLALKRLERQADTDPLTNLLSLTGLYRKIEELVDRVEDAGETQFADEEPNPRAPTLVSVQMTNADSIEQLLGARQSDVLERATGGALAMAAPEVVWARTSKAHFVGLLTDHTVELQALLTKINFAVVESRALLDDTVGRPMWTVAAVTLTTHPPPPVEVIMACLRRTEQQAQESRQVLVTAVDRQSAHALKEEAEQAERIRQIIQQKQLVLYAQPIVANVNPGAMPHKYEVLIRLRDAQGGIIPPGVFLPVAMRAGMMQLLDMSVMEQTFEWFATHPHALEKLNHCAINLSGPTVASPVIAQRIAQGLKLHQLPAHKFTFEITESQAIANPAQATDTIRAIRECGCRVAIDDFGTGVATFDYLKRFDVDYIKIDGAFIQSLLDDPVDRVIVESMVKVAHQLKVRTVAEFVSSPELQKAVTELGVDESQGYVFGAPRPLHEWFANSD